MRRLALMLAAAICVQAAASQTRGADKAEPSMAPPAAGKTPSDPGAVVVPPRTGTEEIVKTPRKAVDPKIDDATEDIDRKNRKRSEQKSAK
ncbi:MAG TPA: hypothetical protein VEC35_12095 [Noviherbaspirillum sp.]|nr:hypothetical protein [Noviherbaspirillum sp.]